MRFNAIPQACMLIASLWFSENVISVTPLTFCLKNMMVTLKPLGRDELFTCTYTFASCFRSHLHFLDPVCKILSPNDFWF